MPDARSELCDLPLVEVASLIEEGSVSPVDVTESVLQRIEALEPNLNAFITLLPEEARQQASIAEREIRDGHYRGPLHGIPISVKDLFSMTGTRTTAGSRILADWFPSENATVVERLLEAGAILIGKTNMLEFAYASVHPDYGPALNPWDTTRSSSGSSSGSAVAVAVGMGYGSIGSDTGGSIRIPAAFCGIVGMKPTYGRVSRNGAIPVSWSCDHMGPMTRTVADCAALLGAIAGRDQRDSTSSHAPVPDYLSELDDDVSNLRIGIADAYLRENVDREVQVLVDKAIEQFTVMGATFETVPLPPPSEAVPALLAIITSEAAEYHLPALQTRPEDFSEPVRERLELGVLTPATSYIRAQRLRRQFIDRITAAMAGVDLLLMPTSPVVNTPLENDLATSEQADPELLAAMINFTGPFDLCGFPALTLPSGFVEPGWPVGLQLVARPFEEQILLSAAWAYERAMDWHRRLPKAVAELV